MTPLSPQLSERDLTDFDPAGGRGGRWLCPLCGPEHRQDAAHRSLSVERSTGAWLCHRCGASGLLLEHQTRRLAREDREWERLLARQARPEPRRQPRPEPRPEPTSPPWGHLERLPLAGSPGEDYLAGRGLPLPPPEADARWCPRFGPQGRPGRPAVLFAIRDGSGAPVAVQGRFVDGGSPKVMSLGPISRGLFATPGALAGPRLVVTEAPLDALALALSGVPALATCGKRKGMPDWFVELARGREVVAAHDADAAGDQMAQDVADFLGTEVVRLRPIWDGEDWASILDLLGPEALAAGVADLLPPDDATGDLRWLRQLGILLENILIRSPDDDWWAPWLAMGAATACRPTQVLVEVEALISEVDADASRVVAHAQQSRSVGQITARTLAAEVLIAHFTGLDDDLDDPDDPDDDLSRF